jgi:LuxR family maltose regulon positive regulatory protein
MGSGSVRTQSPRPPRIRSDSLVRERLLRQLDAGVASALTLVTAPAGFGKTTLLAQWASHVSMPVAWMRVREQHADARTLFGAITEAVQGLFSARTTLTDSSRLLRYGARAPERYVASTLIRELCEIPGECVLVIDDFHLVVDDVILNFVIELADEAADTLHLVLASRVDPSLPLERVRASGELTEIRASALQFTLDEVETFLVTQLGADTSRAVASEATARTEGWIAGLRLAVLSVKADPRPEQFLARLRASGGQYVMGYLLSEVLAQQPPDVQNFLLRTSLLDQFTGDLCDAFADSDEAGARGREILDWIDHHGLFLIRIDEQRDWYRYHALFQQLLQQELTARFRPDEVADLHRRASEWYAKHDMMDEALRHALSIEDYETASHLIERQMEQALNEQRWRDLERWLKLLPDTVVQERPALLIAQAVIHSVQQRLRAVPPLLRRAAQLMRIDSGGGMEPQIEALQGISDTLWAQDLYDRNESAKGARAALRAVAALPSTSTFARGSAIMWSALLKQMAGQGEDASQKLERLIDTDESPSVTARALLALCIMSRYAGHLERCQASAERLLTYAQRHHLLLDINWAHYFLGWAAYERNQLDEARDHLLTVSEQRYFANTISACDSMSLLALTYHALGRATEAEEALYDLNYYAVELNHTSALAAVAALRARLALARDDLVTAQAMYPWLNRPSSPPTPMLSIFPPSLTQARILVALDDETSWRSAIEQLAVLEQFAQSTHDQWRVYIIRSLLAVARFRLGQQTEAIALVQETLLAAQHERLVRTFADCGPEFAGLLRAVQLKSLPPGLPRYINEILVACSIPHGTDASEVAASKGISEAQSNLISPLTTREIEVLFMLDQRLTDKEIAQALVISTFTVQTHTRSIYRKLDVRDRREAAQRARALGFVRQASASGLQ